VTLFDFTITFAARQPWLMQTTLTTYSSHAWHLLFRYKIVL